MTNSTCQIWSTPATLETTMDYGNAAVINSPRAGGRYVVGGMVEMHIQGFDDENKAKITTWIIDQNRLGNSPAHLTQEVVQQIYLTPRLSVLERRDRLIKFLGQRLESIGQDVEVAGKVTDAMSRDKAFMKAWTESLDDNEVGFLISSGEQEGLLEKVRNGNGLRLTTKGYEFLEHLDGANAAASQAFIAMWFDKSMKDAYDMGIVPAIQEAGFKPVRIDQKEHINKIDDEIIAEIRRSRFIVADFTSNKANPRGGVYFEAGFAYGLNIPVIWTCQKEMIDDVHFDTRQFNHIVWTDADDLCIKLRNRIGAVIGDGPLKKQNEGLN